MGDPHAGVMSDGVMEGRGKRGGVRVIYFWANAKDQLLMLYIYSKHEQDDLTPEQLKILRKIIEEEYHG